MLLDRKRDPESAAAQWEQEMIDAYMEHRWAQILSPLCEQLDRWKAGERNYDDIVEAIRAARKADDAVQGILEKDHEWLVKVIQLEEDWFLPWLANHPPPPGYVLLKF